MARSSKIAIGASPMGSVIGGSTAALLLVSLRRILPAFSPYLGTERLGVTIPFVLYGIFRYLYLVHQKRGGGSPTEMLLTGRPPLVCVALRAACVMLILYTPFER
jgi:hypothetical protein